MARAGTSSRRLFLYDWDNTLFPSFVYKAPPEGLWVGQVGKQQPYLTSNDSIVRSIFLMMLFFNQMHLQRFLASSFCFLASAGGFSSEGTSLYFNIQITGYRNTWYCLRNTSSSSSSSFCFLLPSFFLLLPDCCDIHNTYTPHRTPHGTRHMPRYTPHATRHTPHRTNTTLH